MSEAFITGSHAYGSPTDQSDVDLVVRMNEYTFRKLQELSDADPDMTMSDGTPQLRFGQLNIVACTSDHEFACWLVGTRRMLLDKKNRPFKKSRAKKILDGLRKKLGLFDKGDSYEERKVGAECREEQRQDLQSRRRT